MVKKSGWYGGETESRNRKKKSLSESRKKTKKKFVWVMILVAIVDRQDQGRKKVRWSEEGTRENKLPKIVRRVLCRYYHLTYMKA